MGSLIHSVKGKDIMPYDDPRWMGGIGMIGTKAVYNAVMGCDVHKHRNLLAHAPDRLHDYVDLHFRVGPTSPLF
jgi:hypothetical protein